ncbi:hypothetical protein ACFWNN_12635 [Lentzea sp. NPDC058450]|uniref:hypothetical protein n=1 Tax=Lentzea sp. NPDC058450 TaxID=3346505 RepID=UPI00365EBEFC
MTPRRRVITAVGAAAVLVAAVLALRTHDDALQKPSSEAVRLTKYTADYVSVPDQPARPNPPSSGWSSDGRVQWLPVNGAVGYEVGGRLVASPEITGSGRPEIRAVDAFGQRSAPVRAEERPSDDGWRRAVAGSIDEFDDTFFARRYHLSAREGCVNPSSGSNGRLVLDMPCGNDTAVLRARTLLRLSESPELGRVVVVTDAAGPRGSSCSTWRPERPTASDPYLLLMRCAWWWTTPWPPEHAARAFCIDSRRC